MEKPNLDEVITALKGKFGEQILQDEMLYDYRTITISKDSIVPVVRYLRDHERYQFGYLTTLCGLHYPGTAQPFGMMYQLHSLVHNLRIRFKLFTTENDLQIDSITSVFPAANWMEREAFDFFGFRFKGHPNLKRILNVEDMDYHPLRKEYPIEDRTRFDKDDTMFGRNASDFNRKKLIP
ncbi:MAG TPA: NADH-quinone oxidoreductase subunit C [Bacteroidia bacterium]|nr:NADH-quinone oxidoreductase subunit C [Bacteroidia bacterium]HNP97564.1 NADH-quinone oxidoreductase subunit C [Bacteroidia bacterium]